MTTRNIAIVAAVAVAALAGAFYAGRATKPTQVTTKTEWLTHTEYKDREVVKWKDREVIKWRTQYASTVDSDTKCVEDYDRVNGKLVKRTCEKTNKKVAVGGGSGSSSSTSTGTSTTTSSGSTTAQGKSETITRYDRASWNVSLGASLSFDDIVHGQLAHPTLHLEVDHSIFGPFSVGAWAQSDTSFGDKRLGLNLSLALH